MTEDEKIKFFNENFEIFDLELEKRRRKWQLKAIPSLDYSDIKQIILFHIFKKLDLYDSSKSPLSHWCNTLISNQLTNLFRNLYLSFSKPCARCACCLPDDGCELYQEQSKICPLYSHWLTTKKSAADIRLPLPSETHTNEISNLPGSEPDFEKAEAKLHEEMLKILYGTERRIYIYLFIEHLSETDTAKKVGFTCKEKHRPIGYNSVLKYKKSIIIKVKKLKEEIDLF